MGESDCLIEQLSGFHATSLGYANENVVLHQRVVLKLSNKMSFLW